MQTVFFLEACKEAEDLVSTVSNVYRAAAFQVALESILSTHAPERKATKKAVASTAGNGDSIRSETQLRILQLAEEGFFDEPQLPNAVRGQLRTQGFHHNASDVRMSLLRLAQKKMLRRLHDGGDSYRYGRP